MTDDQWRILGSLEAGLKGVAEDVCQLTQAQRVSVERTDLQHLDLSRQLSDIRHDKNGLIQRVQSEVHLVDRRVVHVETEMKDLRTAIGSICQPHSVTLLSTIAGSASVCAVALGKYGPDVFEYLFKHVKLAVQ